MYWVNDNGAYIARIGSSRKIWVWEHFGKYRMAYTTPEKTEPREVQLNTSNLEEAKQVAINHYLSVVQDELNELKTLYDYVKSLAK